MKNTKKLIFMSILVAQSLVLYIVESYIPNPFIAVAPGAKLGLSNIITLIALIFLGFKDTFIVLITRIIMASMFSGGLSAFLYSITGGILSLIMMSITLRLNKINYSLIGVSIIGSIFHNIGQLIMASIIIQNKGIFIYLPILLLSSIPTGLFIGLVCRFITYNKNIYNVINIKNNRPKIGTFKKMDIILITILIIGSLGSVYIINLEDRNDVSSKWLEIVVEGKIYKKVLIKDKEYKEKIKVNTEHGYNYVYIHDGGVEIIDADCYDKICVKTGFIDRKGEIIACLPHKMYIKILGENKEVDNISY
ncbi:Gx transporter family protein [Tepidibacter formicigenes]|jgi:heptaprenyl diphosphate synthase|uniref:Uncharacterized membrane protein n=1 Tax=Tepidibacter formicigenes DSM 15518 TaxID=1123349 RepID=A0A1M6LC75_9FIRM|nr:Gx transporter family protein [Tepidibacter formicigenes]SHJ68768.1 Uncharacterized membrane protein [Tepidibacter formicigenes DSM 15518]